MSLTNANLCHLPRLHIGLKLAVGDFHDTGGTHKQFVNKNDPHNGENHVPDIESRLLIHQPSPYL
jgi:hypothetical protein